MKITSLALTAAITAILISRAFAAEPDPLAVGVAGHAFDHLGAIGEQANATADSGANIIYATGLGSAGYEGLPPPEELEALRSKSAAYVHRAKDKGIRLAIGYVCATSIVNLPAFDKNWPEAMRAAFKTPPKDWLQCGRDGKPLPSWYGGKYEPACMNNPDWRTYQKRIVEHQLKAGHDGIFFDNPTVHPQGCYCEHCMRKFAALLQRDEREVKLPEPQTIEALRELPAKHPQQFLRFRASIAADFLREMREHARTINPNALVTCNNSLNSPDVFYSQCRTYGYNIHAMSEVEDLVVVEDQANQPRTLANGKTLEYGPVYEMLHAISHGKPVVAVTIAEGDYHTPPNLVRLAMAEAVAHRASYLTWPTWPEAQRQKMIAQVRPQADLLRRHADLLNGTQPLADVAVYAPFSRWLQTAQCHPLDICRQLTRDNWQYVVMGEELLEKALPANGPKVLLAESPQVLSDAARQSIDRFTAAGGRVVWSGEAAWLKHLEAAVGRRAVVLRGPPTVRAIVAAKGTKTIVHVLNLNVSRGSSFEDRVVPARDLNLQVRCKAAPHRVDVLTADAGATTGKVAFQFKPDGESGWVEFTLPSVAVSAIVVIDE